MCVLEFKILRRRMFTDDVYYELFVWIILGKIIEDILY